MPNSLDYNLNNNMFHIPLITIPYNFHLPLIALPYNFNYRFIIFTEPELDNNNIINNNNLKLLSGDDKVYVRKYI